MNKYEICIESLVQPENRGDNIYYIEEIFANTLFDAVSQLQHYLGDNLIKNILCFEVL